MLAAIVGVSGASGVEAMEDEQVRGEDDERVRYRTEVAATRPLLVQNPELCIFQEVISSISRLFLERKSARH